MCTCTVHMLMHTQMHTLMPMPMPMLMPMQVDEFICDVLEVWGVDGGAAQSKWLAS